MVTKNTIHFSVFHCDCAKCTVVCAHLNNGYHYRDSTERVPLFLFPPFRLPFCSLAKNTYVSSKIGSLKNYITFYRWVVTWISFLIFCYVVKWDVITVNTSRHRRRKHEKVAHEHFSKESLAACMLNLIFGTIWADRQKNKGIFKMLL